MDQSNLHFRHSLLFLYDMKKSAAEAHETLVEAYGDAAPSYASCRVWFQRFKSGDFDIDDMERSGLPEKFDDNEQESLIGVNLSVKHKRLADELGIDNKVVKNKRKKRKNSKKKQDSEVTQD